MKNFGEYLKETRKRIMTQRELANKVGVGHPYISKIENNIEPPPSDEVLTAFALAIGVDVDEMFVEAHKIPKDLAEIVLQRPKLFKLIRAMQEDKMVQYLVEHFEELGGQNEDVYWNLFNDNAKSMLLIDPDTLEIVNANAAATKFYNYTLQQLKAMKITSINILPEEEVFKELQKTKLEIENHFNFKHRLSNNEIVEVNVKSFPVLLGNKVYVSSTIQDITEL